MNQKSLLLCTGLLALLMVTGCRKVEYNTIGSAAYLRVFNSLNYTITLVNKDQPPPYVTMVIDPVFDPATGIATGGAIVGDFLDKRLSYAPPFPTSAGNTSVNNNEYPGKEKVLAAPVVNGFDLSSWAQIPSGKHRFLFFSRPYNTVPFFQLPASSRKVVMADSTVELKEGEIYTMEIVQPDVQSTQTSLYIRNEQFHKIPFSDSLLYINFYNLSAAGYANSSASGAGIRDTMNIYYTLCYPDNINGNPGNTIIPGYNNVYMTTLRRSLQSTVAPYYSMPLFAAKDNAGGLHTLEWELFSFLAPSYQIPENPYPYYDNPGNWTTFRCSDSYYSKGFGASPAPNLAITTASGLDKNKSFSTVNTLEVVNQSMYLMSVQRLYAPPVNR